MGFKKAERKEVRKDWWDGVGKWVVDDKGVWSIWCWWVSTIMIVMLHLQHSQSLSSLAEAIVGIQYSQSLLLWLAVTSAPLFPYTHHKKFPPSSKTMKNSLQLAVLPQLLVHMVSDPKDDKSWAQYMNLKISSRCWLINIISNTSQHPNFQTPSHHFSCHFSSTFPFFCYSLQVHLLSPFPPL